MIHAFRSNRLVLDEKNRKVCSMVRFVNKNWFFLLQVVAGVIGSCHAQASLIKGLLESRSRGLGSKEPWQGSCIKGRICSSLTVTVLDSKSRGLGLAPGWINMLCSWEKTVIHCVIHQVTGLLQTNVMTRAQLFEGWFALTNI